MVSPHEWQLGAGDLAGVDNPCGRDIAVATAGRDLDPRSLSHAVFVSSGTVHAGAPDAERRAETWRSWTPARQERELGRLAALLDATWPAGCTPEALLAATHRHLGDLDGELSLARCRVADYGPTFTKPFHAFWTCQVVPGTGPVGFETLVQELNPRRSYASWDVHLDVDAPVVVDSPADWDALVGRTGPDPERHAPTPRWDRLGVGAVHVTNRAVIGSFAPGATHLWDWGMEQTAWFAPTGTYTRLCATEPWARAVERLRRGRRSGGAWGWRRARRGMQKARSLSPGTGPTGDW